MELAFYACMIGLWLAFGPHGAAGMGAAALAGATLADDAVAGHALSPHPPVGGAVHPFFAIGMLFHRVWSGTRRWQDNLISRRGAATLYVAGTFDLFVAGCVLIALFAAVLGELLRPSVSRRSCGRGKSTIPSIWCTRISVSSSSTTDDVHDFKERWLSGDACR